MTIQNTELLRRISISGLHSDDAREIIRIFPVLTEEKQLQIFETWEGVIASIKLHRQELEQEKEILLVQALENIESDLEEYGRTLVHSGAKKTSRGSNFKYKYYFSKNKYMVQNNAMHSKVLHEEIFQTQPGPTELQKMINTTLAQFSPERHNSQKVQETLSRINSISETLTSLVGETRAELVKLYTVTVADTHFTHYSEQVAILESHQRNRIANILGASNDAKFTKSA